MESRVRRRCGLSVTSTASFFRVRLHGIRGPFEALQPPRVRYPISWHGERHCLAIRWLSAEPKPGIGCGWSSSVRMVSRAETTRPSASAPAPIRMISLHWWLTTRPARQISRNGSAFIRLVSRSLPSTSRFIAVFKLWAQDKQRPPSDIGAEQCERQLPTGEISFHPQWTSSLLPHRSLATRSSRRRRPCGWSRHRTVRGFPGGRIPASGTPVALDRLTATGAAARGSPGTGTSLPVTRPGPVGHGANLCPFLILRLAVERPEPGASIRSRRSPALARGTPRSRRHRPQSR
jgi:hypothetical protein